MFFWREKGSTMATSERVQAREAAVEETEWEGVKERAGDRVFADLAANILRGEPAAGDSMPAEADLAWQYGVSKPVVRQAMHRLAAARLVSVRQGGRARVEKPWLSGSLTVIELVYRMANELGNKDGVLASVLEKQYTQGLSVLEIFVRRGSARSKEFLLEETRRHASGGSSAASLEKLEREFWRTMAWGTNNRVLEAEMAFWYDNLTERPRMPRIGTLGDHVKFYVELARRIVADQDPIAFYMKALAPTMRAVCTFEQPEKPGKAEKAEKTEKPAKRRSNRGAR
jgi:DNA-binding FadR family transcriptional regulator